MKIELIFLHADTNLRKMKVTNNYWVDVVKNGYGLFVHGLRLI